MMYKAEVGDIIIITEKELSIFGRECVVVDNIDCPASYQDASKYTWAKFNTGNYDGVFWLFNNSFELVKRSHSVSLVPCLDCNGKGEIELLTSTVKCECQKK